MALSLFEIACRDWDAAFRSPEQLELLLPNGGVLADPRDSYLGVLPPQFRALQKNGINFTTQHGSWIKKDNFRAPSGVHKRKRKPEGRSVRDRNAMAPLNLAQHQRHYVHLMSRVLNIRTNASPFTLLLDDLNQRAMPFVSELVRRALSRNVNVVVLSFEGTRFHSAVRNISAQGPASGDQIMSDLQKAMNAAKESLVIVDSLYELLNIEGMDMNSLFNLVAGKYASTLVGVYHQDMFPAQNSINAYAPQPLDLIKYMATSVITCKSFAHVLAAKAAKERSLPEPTHGLLQGAEGVVQCLDANDHRGIVLEAEFRRKSGRPESEAYFLRAARRSDYAAPTGGLPYGILKQEYVTLLDMVPAYASKEVLGLVQFAADDMESTFNLALTDKQKQAREGVVLPYFDAQKGEGGEGGRILYDMGSEDDFDEEEDEI
ncbi:Elongator subunit Iki1-domain-containing protein [Paraphoma chrysanthemicola]|nr:Elongator subunit Iki1-domain-containing protein [Paraphoma chrysanthemicola]